MLLITVPHARREASNNHDEGAMQMIPHLRKSLEDYGVPHTFHVGTDFRGILDLNRGESRHTEYAKEFTRLLGLNDLHIDLHSFEYLDEDVPDEQAITEAGDDVREWSMSDVVFLTIDGVTDENFLSYMYEELEEQVIVDDIQTQPYNYLTTFAQVIMDVPSVLIELNEGSAPSYPCEHRQRRVVPCGPSYQGIRSRQSRSRSRRWKGLGCTWTEDRGWPTGS